MSGISLILTGHQWTVPMISRSRENYPSRDRRARKGLKRLKGKTESKNVNQKMVKSKASAVVASLARAVRPSENEQGDGATLAGGEKKNLIPPMPLAGLTTTATMSKKNARTLADTKLEMELLVSVDLEDLMITSPREPTWPR